MHRDLDREENEHARLVSELAVLHRTIFITGATARVKEVGTLVFENVQAKLEWKKALALLPKLKKDREKHEKLRAEAAERLHNLRGKDATDPSKSLSPEALLLFEGGGAGAQNIQDKRAELKAAQGQLKIIAEAVAAKGKQVKQTEYAAKRAVDKSYRPLFERKVEQMLDCYTAFLDSVDDVKQVAREANAAGADSLPPIPLRGLHGSNVNHRDWIKQVRSGYLPA